MAEARAEEDEERLRETRSAEHSDRNKPDQRHSSQGPLSSIRAVIKRTSARTSSQSDPQRERRRPEITILSAEPLLSNTWFPGDSGAFPPAPPPAPPTWAAGSATVQLPPPSYEQVIREKSREQNLQSSSSSSPSSRRSIYTIATQTDKDSPGPQSSAARPVRRPPKPPSPSLPLNHMPEVDRSDPNASAQPRDTLHEQCGVQTDFDDIINDITPIDPSPITTTSTQINLDSPGDTMKEEPRVCPRPQPRSRVALRPNEDILDQPMMREVKVQTLVRLKDDGAENVFAGFDDAPSDISSKYLQDLLEVFGSDATPVQHGESKQSDASNVEEDKKNTGVCEAPCAVITPEPVEPLNRPKPRPRTQKSKPQLTLKPSVFEVFDTREPTVEQNPSKALSPPVPAPRPLLNKLQSQSESRSAPSSKPSPAAGPDSAPPSQQMAAEASSLSKRRNSDDQAINTPVKTAPVIVTGRNVGKRPSVPKHSRPPPPLLRKTRSTSQATVDVSRAADTSTTPLPPRPSSGRPLPLRPPPIKVTKPPGGSSSSSPPAATNQLPGSRVPKRCPPLPPRPKPGHPLYKCYSSKALQGDAERENISKEREAPYEKTSFHEEEPLIVLDDEVPQTQLNTLHDLCPSEVKGQDVTVSGLLLEDEPSEQQIQQNTQNRCVVARFRFEGEEGELSFTEGDVITLMEYVNEEWGRGLLNGQTGIFPLSFIQAIEETESLPRKPALESPAPPAGSRIRGRALYDFTPECEDELHLKCVCVQAGDVVCDLEDMDAKWFLGESGGKRGIVPKNYIQVLLDP
ncbi:SH3 domain-containing protein 19-like isoform X2 [Cyprinus carpio]|uniref:SH3 domain-containing protein 19-like isoform X2 n=1 Tax=Cyprinus carpio TaxID=7962 RepID=A0A9Q9ZQ33_CYPCA|nr:SH3 domain-containing protein 19-like isoform X2 [Cyprinus carpio]